MTASAHGSFAPRGLYCPHIHATTTRSADLGGSPGFPSWGWLYRGASPDDAVWAAAEIVLTLSHPPFPACRYPYAGGNEGTMSRSSPHHWPSPREVGLGSLVSPAPGFMAGPCFDASVFALCCGPQSGSPLDQVPPLSGRQRLLRPSFPRPGHPGARSDMTTQPTGLVLRWDSHPLGECCCELQLPSAGVTRFRRYYGPVRHPRRPGLSLAGFRLAVTSAAAGGFTCCAGSPCAGMPSPLPRRDPWAEVASRELPPRDPETAAFPVMLAGRLPHQRFRGLLSVHSRYGLPARRVARATRCLGGFGGFVTSAAAPIASGWSD